MTKDTSNSVSYNFPADWRGKVLLRISELIKKTDPDITEDVKWKTASNPDGVLVWYHTGMISTGETYKKHLRLTFAKGAALKDHDPKGLINTFRAMIIHEDDELDEAAFQDLIRAAVKLNLESKSKTSKTKKK